MTQTYTKSFCMSSYLLDTTLVGLTTCAESLCADGQRAGALSATAGLPYDDAAISYSGDVLLCVAHGQVSLVLFYSSDDSRCGCRPTGWRRLPDLHRCRCGCCCAAAWLVHTGPRNMRTSTPLRGEWLRF